MCQACVALLLLCCARAHVHGGAAADEIMGGRRWAEGWVSASAAVQPSAIRKVHVIQSCHLDVGFSDLAVNIVNKYFDTFLPEAIAIAKELAAANSTGPGLVFTTQSWLISLYLRCPSSFPAPPAEPPSPSFKRNNCTVSTHCAAAAGCAMPPECRCDCGYPGISKQQCVGSGCCSNGTSSTHDTPSCFFNSSAAHNNTAPPNPPGPAPAPPGPPTQIPLHCPTAAAQADTYAPGPQERPHRDAGLPIQRRAGGPRRTNVRVRLYIYN